MKVEHLLTLGLAALTLLSCEHKALCYDHEAHTPNTRVAVIPTYEREWEYRSEGGIEWESRPDWQEAFGIGYDGLRPSVPSGLRAHVFNPEGHEGYEADNLPATGGVLAPDEGEHALLFHNNDTEYIVFRDMEHFREAYATTRARMRSSYTEPGGEKMPTVNPPDMLFAGSADRYRSELKLEVDTLPVVMRPLVFTYVVFFEITKGLEHVSLARGALGGMAGAVCLHNGERSAERVAVLFDCERYDDGVKAAVRSFGAPGQQTGWTPPVGRADYVLALELKLKNGKRLLYEYDLTDQMSSQPCGGVIGVRGIEIPEDQTEGPDSGFDVDVDDWGDYEEIDLPL